MEAPLSRVFAAVQPMDVTNVSGEEPENRAGIVLGQRGGRVVQVSAMAELSAAPDAARVCIRVSSSKGSAAEARSSVQRRLDYIAQSLRQGALPDKDITISKEIQKNASAYQMDAEVCVVFKDFEKLQNISNILVEKLDSSVSLSSPHFYHTPENTEKLRREVCLNAVCNARRKAQEVCRLVGQSLGKAIVIREDEMKEWEEQGEVNVAASFQQKIQSATLYVASKVFATFEIKGKDKNKKGC
ncbi:interleukin-1 receptor-associated kinase 1-binding protein 1 [Gastrophryne carolinensis]